MAKNAEEKRRAAEYVLLHMEQRGWNPAALQVRTGLDPQTVRTFLAGTTWPQTSKRQAIEEAFGWNYGRLDLVASGLMESESETGDPVEVAILRSDLSRANQHKLIGTYYEMLDRQGGGGHGSSAAM